MDAKSNVHEDWAAAGEPEETGQAACMGATHGQTAPLNNGEVHATQNTGQGGHDRKPPKKRTGLVGLLLAGMLMLGMVLGGAGAGAVLLAAGNYSNGTATLPAITAADTGTGSNSSNAQLAAQLNEITINSIYQATSPSVVRVNTIVQTGNGRFGGTGEATGTGLVLDKQGNILTNYHVIQGANSIRVEFANGTEYTATVVGTAEQDDLAIIKIIAPSNVLVPARLGDSSKVAVGDAVIAIGYPYGMDQSVTSGIVSGLDRDGAGSANSRTLSGLIQIDAAINPGNSGGPLLNAQGEVIGINTMIESPVEGFTGVGLAIPINQAKSLLTQLEAGGTVERPWIGISGTEITPGMQSTYNLPVDSGILVMDVTPGSPAEKAGLQGSTTAASQDPTGANGSGQLQQVGDIIVAIDGHKVGSVADLTTYLNGKTPGQSVTLQIIRNGSQQQVKVTLGSWSANAN